MNGHCHSWCHGIKELFRILHFFNLQKLRSKWFLHDIEHFICAIVYFKRGKVNILICLIRQFLHFILKNVILLIWIIIVEFPTIVILCSVTRCIGNQIYQACFRVEIKFQSLVQCTKNVFRNISSSFGFGLKYHIFNRFNVFCERLYIKMVFRNTSMSKISITHISTSYDAIIVSILPNLINNLNQIVLRLFNPLFHWHSTVHYKEKIYGFCFLYLVLGVF